MTARHNIAVMTARDELPVLSFARREELRAWLEAEHATSLGIWVRLFKKSSGVASITFEDLLDEGLCFGWSESLRRACDQQSYLQKFTPRKTRGTTSARNMAHAEQLIAAGLMTPAGLAALGPVADR
jgi:uncharacterized protein YdeI (YjbR/CyaY-like superfamily)